MFFAFIYVKSDESTQNPGRRPLHHHEKRIQAQHILPLRKRRTPTSQGLQSKLFSLSVFGQQALIVNLPRDYPPEPEIGTACAMPTCWESATCASTLPTAAIQNATHIAKAFCFFFPLFSR